MVQVPFAVIVPAHSALKLALDVDHQFGATIADQTLPGSAVFALPKRASHQDGDGVGKPTFAGAEPPLAVRGVVRAHMLRGYQSRKDRRKEGSNKTVVMGIVERGGNIIAGPVPDSTQATLAPIVHGFVARDSIVSTDEAQAYSELHRTFREHGAVNHKAKEYVRGIHHTNTLEGHWSLLKRAIHGTHTSVSAKHLWKYVSEFSYRRNTRGNPSLMFNRLVVSLSLPRLEVA